MRMQLRNLEVWDVVSAWSPYQPNRNLGTSQKNPYDAKHILASFRIWTDFATWQMTAERWRSSFALILVAERIRNPVHPILAWILTFHNAGSFEHVLAR